MKTTIKKRIYLNKDRRFKIAVKKFYAIIASILIGSAFIGWHSKALERDLISNQAISAVQAQETQEKDDNCLKALIGTKMEDAIPEIRKAAKHYDLPEELFIGIAFAESSFNRFRCFNPWGIDTGKGNDPRCYQDWKHGANGFAQLIKFYYYGEGKFTAEQLVRKYVGYQNDDWVRNVKIYYNPEIIIK